MSEFVCAYCEKPASTKSGLTNHMKACKKKPASDDLRDVDPRDKPAPAPRATPPPRERSEPRQEERRPPKTNGKQPFNLNIGAFMILPDIIPVLLDINFAIALGEYILDKGSENKAILAFGHQCRKLAEDE